MRCLEERTHRRGWRARPCRTDGLAVAACLDSSVQGNLRTFIRTQTRLNFQVVRQLRYTANSVVLQWTMDPRMIAEINLFAQEEYGATTDKFSPRAVGPYMRPDDEDTPMVNS